MIFCRHCNRSWLFLEKASIYTEDVLLAATTSVKSAVFCGTFSRQAVKVVKAILSLRRRFS